MADRRRVVADDGLPRVVRSWTGEGVSSANRLILKGGGTGYNRSCL